MRCTVLFSVPAVVIWRDVLGGVQSWPHPLPCHQSFCPHQLSSKWPQTEEAQQCSVYPSSVSSMIIQPYFACIPWSQYVHKDPNKSAVFTTRTHSVTFGTNLLRLWFCFVMLHADIIRWGYVGRNLQITGHPSAKLCCLWAPCWETCLVTWIWMPSPQTVCMLTQLSRGFLPL